MLKIHHQRYLPFTTQSNVLSYLTELLYPSKQSLWAVYWNRPVGRFVHKIFSGQLLEFQSNSLDTWQKCSLGAVDVQNTHFVKIP